MKIIKKLIIIAALLSAPFTQAVKSLARTEFETAAKRTFFATTAITVIAACAQGNFYPIKTLIPAAIVGIGMGTLGYLDDRALKKDLHCGANKRNSLILQALIIAAGLTPIILSDSEFGTMLRKTLKPTGEYILKAGTAVVDTIALGLTLNR